MAGKKNVGGGEGSKKAQGQARKAEQANKKAAAENAKLAAVEDAEWEKGAKKGSAKKATAEEKKAEAARKKAEREALLAEEEKSLPTRAAPKNAKTAVKKTKGIDQALGEVDSGPLADLNATGIENALDALGLASDTSKIVDVDKHPERRMGKGYEAWMKRVGERREEELKGQVRQSTRKDILWKEFLASPENPKNQVVAEHNATREELREIQAEEKRKIEARLGS